MSDNEKLLNAVSLIDDKYLNKYFELKLRNSQRRSKTTTHISKWAVIAAAVAVISVATVGIALHMSNFPTNIPPTGSTSNGTDDVQRPDLESVIWYQFNSDDAMDEGNNQNYRIGDARVSAELYYVMQKHNGTFGIYVKLPDGNLEDALQYFNKTSIYCEIKNNTLFIFPTNEEFENLKLNDEQKENWLFALASKNNYTGEAQTERPSIVVGDLDQYPSDIQYGKVHFYIENGDKALTDARDLADSINDLYSHSAATDEITILLWFKSNIDAEPEYQEIVASRGEGDPHEFREKLNAFSKKYHNDLVMANIWVLEPLPISGLTPVAYAPCAQFTMKISDVDMENMILLISAEEITSISISLGGTSTPSTDDVPDVENVHEG